MNYRIICALLLMAVLVGTAGAATLIVYPTYDTSPYRDATNTSFSSLRNGAGTTASANYYVYLDTPATGSLFWRFERGIMVFNLSAIPTGSTINSAVLSEYGVGKGNALGNPTAVITNCSPVNPASLQTSDFNTFRDFIMASNISYAGFTTTGYNNFTFTSTGIQYLTSKIGSVGTWTSLMNRLSWDVDNSFSGTYANGSSASFFQSYQIEQTSTKKTFLTITYTLPDTTPPASITGLTNQTITSCTGPLNWNWTNPADADFALTRVFQNGAFLHNVTTNYDSWSGLSGSTAYTIGTRTCDATGNCNSTWVNATATTQSCTVAPVTNFTTDNTTICLNENIQFNDTSINSPESWLWDFGDSITSTLQNVSHTYGSAGIFTVSLTATNTAGSNTATKPDYITVNDCSVPATSFTYNVTCGVGNLSVNFTDTSTGGVTYYWNFGDGNISTTQSPVYQYISPGQFTVAHSATNTYGTAWSNITNLITVAVNGTFCTGGGTCNTTSGNITHYNSSNIIASQPVQMTTEYVWIIFALLGIALLLLSTMGFDWVVKDITSVLASLFLFISTIQAFAVDTVTGYGVTGINDGGVHEFVLMENHTIYHYDFIGVALGIVFIISLANLYRLWLDYKRVGELTLEEKGEMPEEKN